MPGHIYDMRVHTCAKDTARAKDGTCERSPRQLYASYVSCFPDPLCRYCLQNTDTLNFDDSSI